MVIVSLFVQRLHDHTRRAVVRGGLLRAVDPDGCGVVDGDVEGWPLGSVVGDGVAVDTLTRGSRRDDSRVTHKPEEKKR